MMSLSTENEAGVSETVTRFWSWTFDHSDAGVALGSISDLEYKEVQETAAKHLIKILQGLK